jgi:hypothetical protein
VGDNNCRDPVVADASSWLQGSVGATATGNELGHLRGRSQSFGAAELPFLAKQCAPSLDRERRVLHFVDRWSRRGGDELFF